jgi:hypothetical protein
MTGCLWEFHRQTYTYTYINTQTDIHTDIHTYIHTDIHIKKYTPHARNTHIPPVGRGVGDAEGLVRLAQQRLDLLPALLHLFVVGVGVCVGGVSVRGTCVCV